MEEINKTHNTPKDVFLHLLNILTFYLSVVSFITLYIQYISAIFPDQLNFYYTGIADAVRMFTSMMVIAVPVFILTSWMIGRDLKSNPEKREFRLRKWLLYFTLFVSAVTIIVDLIKFVYSFLSGELTIQFLLKVVIVLLTAVAVFGYYIWDLRRKDKEISKTPKNLAWIISFIVLASVIAGFFIIGTPAAQRAKRFDDQRISNLQILQSQIVDYWVRKKSLPQSFSDLENSITGFYAPKDPQSDTPYGYKIIDALSFELCAAFKTSSKDFGQNLRVAKPYYPYDSFQQNWEYKTGETCFTRTIDPELYKNIGQPQEPATVYPIK
ncbi:MAG: hypothetical protein HYT20_00810 [Candidatus Nealsonbacteria bacterium]|nr:hypothetical protein [Candidatus Nealsonbacteria bacterium]